METQNKKVLLNIFVLDTCKVFLKHVFSILLLSIKKI